MPMPGGTHPGSVAGARVWMKAIRLQLSDSFGDVEIGI